MSLNISLTQDISTFFYVRGTKNAFTLSFWLALSLSPHKPDCGSHSLSVYYQSGLAVQHHSGSPSLPVSGLSYKFGIKPNADQCNGNKQQTLEHLVWAYYSGHTITSIPHNHPGFSESILDFRGCPRRSGACPGNPGHLSWIPRSALLFHSLRIPGMCIQLITM